MQCLGRRILFSISPSPIKLVVQSVQKTTLLYENFCKRTSEALFSYYCSRISNCFRRLEERAVEVRLDSGLLRQALHNVHTLQNSADHQVGLVQQLSVFEVRVWEGGGGDAPSCAVGARQRGLRDLHQLSVHKLKFRPRLLTLAALQPLRPIQPMESQEYPSSWSWILCKQYGQVREVFARECSIQTAICWVKIPITIFQYRMQR